MNKIKITYSEQFTLFAKKRLYDLDVRKVVYINLFIYIRKAFW